MSLNTPSSFDDEAILRDMQERQEQRMAEIKPLYTEGFFAEISKKLQASPKDAKHFKKAILEAGAAYKSSKSKYEENYLPPKQRNKNLTTLITELKRVQNLLEELMTSEQFISPAQSLIYELLYKREEGDELETKFVESIFHGYEYHFHDYDGELPSVSSLEELRDLIEIRHPYKNILGFFNLLTQACEKAEADKEAFFRKESALSQWIFILNRAWPQNSPVDFTVGHYYEGIGYNSEALHILHEIMAPLDSEVPLSAIATAMRKQRADKRKIRRGEI